MEVFFILGPGLAGALAAAPWAGTGLVIGASVMVAGCDAVRAEPGRPRLGRRAVRPPPAARRAGQPRDAHARLAALGFGVVIGFVEVAVPASATNAGHATIGGLLLSAWSVSSVVFGVAYSLRPWPRPMGLRLPVLLAAFGVLVALLGGARRRSGDWRWPCSGPVR